jgi:agmatinase
MPAPDRRTTRFKHQLVAADVVELAPQLDPSGVSAVLAAKVVRSLVMLLNGD